MSAAPSREQPLSLDPTLPFAELRQALARCEFTEPAIRRALNAQSAGDLPVLDIPGLPRTGQGRDAARGVDPALLARRRGPGRGRRRRAGAGAPCHRGGDGPDQWIGHRPATEYKLIMRTFLDVFPDATLWFDAGLMVGSKAPLRIDPSTLDAKRRDPRIRAALDDIGLVEFETLRSWYTAGPEEMRRFVGAGPILTDDQPLVEYHRSLPTSTAPLDLTGLSGDVSRITPRN